MYKGIVYGKIQLVDEPFTKNNRKYCKAKCLWCGKEIVSQLRLLKKGRGCACRKQTLSGLNKKFGKLTILEMFGNRVKCKCDCGTIKTYNKYNVMFGTTNSCGCEKRSSLIDRNTKHNGSGTRLYNIYLSMKKRCYREKEHNYKWYGGKGIGVCNEWLGYSGFINFFNWAKDNGYKDNLTIERIDINKGYNPSNCKWIPLEEQCLNTSKTIRIISGDKIKHIRDLSKEYNIPKSTLYSRAKVYRTKIKTNIIKEENIVWGL